MDEDRSNSRADKALTAANDRHGDHQTHAADDHLIRSDEADKVMVYGAC